MTRYYYAGYSDMGTNYTYNCACWQAYAFSSKNERDAWIRKNEYKDGNRVAKIIDRRAAYKIIGLNSMYKSLVIDDNGRMQAPWK